MTPSGPPENRDAANPGADRRTHTRLRVIFESACEITAPFFDPKQGWGGEHLTLYAQQALRNAYPDLSFQEMTILSSAVRIFHMSRWNKHSR